MDEQTGLVKKEETLTPEQWEKQLKLVKELTAKNCTDTEFELLQHLAREHKLDPLKKEIWAVKGYGNSPAQIFISRDGLINIAHRTQQFGSMKTTCEIKKNPDELPGIEFPISATCEIWRKDYDKPFENTVYFDEYDKKYALWKEKPKAMLMKVAESTCLRRAFNIAGMYVPEEMPLEKTGEVKENGRESK